MTTPLELVQTLLENPDIRSAKLEGSAGTGKTTGLSEICLYLNTLGIPYAVTAFTHKAVHILQSKLPEGTNIVTLHKFLKKRPTINSNATKRTQLTVNSKFGEPEFIRLLVIDEFSMVSEADYMDIGYYQDPEYEGDCKFKVLYVGDSNQLPSVTVTADIRTDIELKLTKVWRQAGDNPILDTLIELTKFVEGTKTPYYLPAHETFIRKVDLVEEYFKSKETDKIILAYTNEKVQSLNASIQGRDYPEIGDIVFDATKRRLAKLLAFVDNPTRCDTPNGELVLDMKFKPLESLIDEGYTFVILEDEDGDQYTVPMIFGMYTYKCKADELSREATEANKAIEIKHNSRATEWAKANPQTPLARHRAGAWRRFLTFNDYVTVCDFSHAMTVHKSQGSTYNEVYVALTDLKKAFDKELLFKLLYVAVSRASNKVYMDE